MSVNGPMKMYKMKPVYELSPDLNLPTCMYKMKNLYSEAKPSEMVSETVSGDDLKLLEIEKHQLNIIQKLEDLKEKVLKMKEEFGVVSHTTGSEQLASIGSFQDIVIKANPASPPLSLWVFYQILSQSTPVRLVSYVHSSLVKIPDFVQNLQSLSSSENCKVSLTLIWRDGNKDHEMMVDPVNQGMIEGEVNISRYIARLLNFNYDVDPISSTQIDNWLEIAHSSIIHGNNKERQAALKSLNSHLGKNSYLVGNSLTLADVILWSSLVQTKLHESLPANVSKWYKALLENEMFACCKSLPLL